MMKKIKDKASFIKNDETGAIINNSISELEAYKRKRDSANKMKRDLEDVKEEVKELKTLILQLLHKN